MYKSAICETSQQYTVEEIKTIVVQLVNTYIATGTSDYGKNLMDLNDNIELENFLYFFDDLKKIYNLPISKYLEIYEYVSFTINDLSEGLYRLLKDEQNY